MPQSWCRFEAKTVPGCGVPSSGTSGEVRALLPKPSCARRDSSLSPKPPNPSRPASTAAAAVTSKAGDEAE
jgi:hypothetical protein